jgi:hypothetical protein
MSTQAIDLSTGLTGSDLSEVFQNNPRAYMAVRGAVAEKHLEILLTEMVRRGEISGFQSASGDMDKDFYLNVNGHTISLECKNVEVSKLGNMPTLVNYLNYLHANGEISLNEITNRLNFNVTSLNELNGTDLKLVFAQCPQKFRESGLARYQYSASQVASPSLGYLSDADYVNQFNNSPLTIDFKRTRNSTDESGNTRRNRFYRREEIDIVAACLFSRTMEWKFLFARAENFPLHPEFPERYSDKLILAPNVWSSDLSRVMST